MKAIAALIGIVLLTGCSAKSVAPAADDNFRQVLDGRGGPRIITETPGTKIEEILEAKYKDLAPAHIEIHGDKVVEGTSTKLGVRIILEGVAASESARSAEDVAVFYLSETQARECVSALRQSLAFKPSADANQYFKWVGPESLTLTAGKVNGMADYSISRGSSNPIMGLNAEQSISFADAITSALDSVAK